MAHRIGTSIGCARYRRKRPLPWILVGLGRLELPTSPLSGARSSHLSYRPSQTEEEKSYNLFSLRCLSLIRNCVQTCILRTRQQFLYHFSLLSVLKMRVV